MAGFVQIIEFTTSKPDEVRAAAEAYRAERETAGDSSVVRGTITRDRDRPDTYLNIVEFASYEEAMANSERPETQELARTMASLCDGPPRFYNLDVQDAFDPART